MDFRVFYKQSGGKIRPGKEKQKAKNEPGPTGKSYCTVKNSIGKALRGVVSGSLIFGNHLSGHQVGNGLMHFIAVFYQQAGVDTAKGKILNGCNLGV